MLCVVRCCLGDVIVYCVGVCLVMCALCYLMGRVVYCDVFRVICRVLLGGSLWACRILCFSCDVFVLF